jgi:hypothetical protein
MPFLLVRFSLLPLCCLVRFPSRRFGHLSCTPRLVLHAFRLLITLSLFHKLVAHRVGYGSPRIQMELKSQGRAPLSQTGCQADA